MRSTILLTTIVIWLVSEICIGSPALRELSTDRPDTTESPFTVDAGHWQVETEIAAWAFDGSNLDSYSLGEVNLKYGINGTQDIQMIVPLYTNTRPGDEGLGELQIRYKINLTGQDEEAVSYGPFGLAIMPYVKFPTAHDQLDNDRLEGGLILPISVELACGWSLGMMAQLDLLADEDSGGYLVSPVVSAAAGRAITDTLGGFLELVGAFTPEAASAQEAYFNAGITWSQQPLTQWDLGIRTGLTSASQDWSPFLGVSRKF